MRRLVAAAVVIAAPQQQPQQPQQPPPASPAPAQQPSEVALVITGDPGTPPRYAVPDFVALSPEAAEAAKTIGEVLWDDLNFEQEFYMIPRDTYSIACRQQSVRRMSRSPHGGNSAPTPSYSAPCSNTGGKSAVQMRLINVRSRQTVFAKEYFNASNPRAYAHTIADEIHMQQRGPARRGANEAGVRLRSQPRQPESAPSKNAR